MPSETPLETADRLAREHRDRVPFHPLPDDLIGNLSHAYATQETFIRAYQKSAADPVFGWKIGLTTRKMQSMCGVDQPIAGAIFASTAKASPAQICATPFQRLGVEMELAVQLARPLPAGAIDAKIVQTCVDQVCAAFEIVEDRGADYARLDAASLIADNSWNAGVVLGAPCAIRDAWPLVGRRAVLERSGELIGEGRTDDAGGDPLDVVAWLASALRLRGREIEPGQWVMTGSVVQTQFAKVGERYRFEIDGLEPVELTVTP